jgi:hypothetical protein
MAVLITADRPDERFYINIIQHDDGNWEAEQMPLDDSEVTMTGTTFMSMGLRSVTQGQVDSYASQAILTNAPADMQRNGLYYMQQHAPGTGDATYASYKDMFDWINAMTAYRDTVKTNISTLTFDQLVVYSIPSLAWPTLPIDMPSTSAFSMEAKLSRKVIQKK